jgi:hypothetical protein
MKCLKFFPSPAVISDGSIEVLSRPPTDPVQAGEGGGDDTTTGSSSSIGAATPPTPSTQPLDDMSNDDASCAALMASDSTTTLQGSSSSSSMLNSFHSADPGAAATARCVVRTPQNQKKSKSFIFPQPIRYMHFRVNKD